MTNDDVVKKGMANLWKGKEAVGGKLYITNESIIHKPHKLNIQSSSLELELADIERVDFFTSKVIGIPLIKNGLLIVDKSGNEYKFVVNGREKWKQELTNLIK